MSFTSSFVTVVASAATVRRPSPTFSSPLMKTALISFVVAILETTTVTSLFLIAEMESTLNPSGIRFKEDS